MRSRGRKEGLRVALEAAQPGTRIVFVGVQNEDADIDLRRVTLGENELIGTNAHAFAADFPEALRLLASRAGGRSDIAPIVIPLDRLLDDGLAPMAEGRVTSIKTLVDPWSDAARPTH